MPESHRTRSHLSTLFLSAGILCTGAMVAEDVREVRYRLIFHNFLDSEPDAPSKLSSFRRRFNTTWYPDTTTVFHDSTQVAEGILNSNGRYLIRSIESRYYGSPGFPYNYTWDIFGPYDSYMEFEKKFREKIGLEPYCRVVRDARNAPWRFWSGEAAERVFERYYGGPENRFQHVTYGYIYDVAAKRYMTDYVTLLNHLLVTKRGDWERLCEEYHNRALSDTNFHGASASSSAVKALFSENDLRAFKAIETNYLYIPVGELMRRQIDGSLPSILRCIRVVLRDYDPENHRRLKA